MGGGVGFFAGISPLSSSTWNEDPVQNADRVTAGVLGYVPCSNGTLDTCVIAGNVNTSGSGGGVLIYVDDPTAPCTPEFNYCTLSGNSTVLHGGAMAVVGNPGGTEITVSLNNCTIAANAATGDGGGVYMAVDQVGTQVSEMLAERTILWGNCTEESGSSSGAAQAFVDSGNGLVFSCSNVDVSGLEGAGEVLVLDSLVTENPSFCVTIQCDLSGTTRGDFQLSLSSPLGDGPCGQIGAQPTSSACFTTSAPDPTPMPTKTALLPCAPNPFNPSTTIRFDVKDASRVTLRIYDVRGRLVRTLIDDFLPPESHRLLWDGLNNQGERVATGIYFLRMVAGATVQVQKMVLLK
jgi:hypothetical protein